MSEQGTPSGQPTPSTRQIDPLLALLLALSAVGLFSAGQMPFVDLAGLYPGSDLFSLLAVTLVFSLILGFAYAAIGAAAPRAGADYVFASRAFSAPLAFSASFTFAVFTSLMAGALIASLPLTVIPGALRAYALASGQEIGSLAADIASQQGVVTLGTLGVVLAFSANLLKPRLLKILLAAVLVIGLAAWGVILFQLASAAPGSFADAWDNALGAGSYLEQIASAQQSGLQSVASTLALQVGGLLIGFWMIFGHFSATFFAGEVKTPGKTLLGSSWLALLIASALIAIIAWVVQSVIPSEFLAAQSILSQTNPTTAPSLLYYAALLAPNVPLVIFAGSAWILLTLSVAVAYFFFTSRIIRAWAIDQILPPGIGQIQAAQKAPLLPLFFISVLALLGLMDASHPGRLLSPFTYALIVAVCMLIPLIALILAPFKNQAWFASAPRLARLRLGPLPLASLAGVISALYLLGLVISHFLFPGNTKPLTWVDWVAFGVIFGGGFLVYSNRKESLRQQNIKLEDVFSDLPQDD